MTDPKEQKEKVSSQAETEQLPVAQEAREKTSEHEKKEEEVQQESVRQRTDTKLEMLEQRDLYAPDNETAESINGMNVESMESEEEIQSSLELLGTVSVSILAKMFEGGFERDEIDTLDEFKTALNRIEDEEKFKELKDKISNVSEKATFEKLREILVKPSTKIYKKLEVKWAEYLRRSKETIDDASKGTASKAWEYVKKNPRNVVLAVAGAFGLYALYKSFIADDEEPTKEKKEWTDRIFNKKTGFAALGVLLIGTLLGSRKIMKFIDTLSGDKKEMAMRAAESATEAVVNRINKEIDFDATKNRLLKLLPQKPEWLKNAKLQNILNDLNLDPEKTAHLEKYRGPGGAALLLKDWIGRKHKLDAATQKVLEKFLEKEKTRTPETASGNREEVEGQYGEMVPAKEAFKNYNKDLQQALHPLKQWAYENKEATASAAMYLAHIDAVQAALSGGMSGAFDSFVGLSKIPFKAVHGFPLSSLFVVSAALVAEDQYQVRDKAGNILLPKDTENLKKYTKKKLHDAGDWARDLPHVPDEQIDKAVDIITTPGLLEQYVAPAKEMIEHAAMGAAEWLALEPKELIQKTNIKGLRLFEMDLANLQREHKEGSEQFEQYTALINEVINLTKKVQSGEKVQKEELTTKLHELAVKVNINIIEHDGYIAWTIVKMQNDIPRTIGPKKILIDPSLSQGDAVNKAQRFVTEDTIYNAIGRGMGVPWEDFRMLVDRIFFEDVESVDEAGKKIEKKLRSGGYLVIYGGQVFLYESAAGAMHRYILGPARVFKHLAKGISGDFSAVDAAVDYSGGILPVAIMGLTTNIVRGNFKKVFSKRLLYESLAYPIKGLADFGKFGMHVGRNIRNPRAIAIDPALKVHADFWATVNKWRYGVSRFKPRTEMNRMLKSEFNDLSALYQAKKLLHEAEYKSFLFEDDIHKQTQDILRDVTGIDSQKIQRDPKALMADIETQIKQREQLVAQIEKSGKLGTALEKMEKGNTRQAERILEKMGYQAPMSKEAIKQELDATKQSMDELDIKLNPDKRSKNPERQKAIQEAEKSLEQPKLSEAEKTKLLDNLKNSKADLEKMVDDAERAITSEMERATESGKPLSDPEVKAKIEKIKTDYDGKFAQFFEAKGLHNLDLLDDATLKKHGFDPEVVRERTPHIEAKIKGHGRLKRVGKGLIGVAAALLAMYGISKGLEWFHSEEAGFEFEKLSASSSPEEQKKREESKKKMRDNPEELTQTLKQIEFYFVQMNKDYEKLNELLGNPQKLKETPDDDLKKLVDEASGKHSQNIEKLKKFVVVNKEAFLLYYEKLPESKEGKDRALGQFFSIGFDTGDNRPYLKYADESDFRETYYEIIDIYRAHIDQLIKGEKLSGWDTAVHAGSYAVPVYGTYLDGRDAVRSLGRGEWASAAKSGGWCVLGAVSDVLMVAGVVSFGATTVAGGALKAVRVGGAGAKGVVKGGRALAMVEKIEKAMKVLRESEKIAKAAKHAHTATMIGMAADVGRQVFIPPKSQTYYF